MSDFEQEMRKNKENKEREEKERQKANIDVFRSYKIKTGTATPPPPQQGSPKAPPTKGKAPQSSGSKKSSPSPAPQKAQKQYTHASQPQPKPDVSLAEPAKVLTFKPRAVNSAVVTTDAPGSKTPAATGSVVKGSEHSSQGHRTAPGALPTNSINFVAVDLVGKLYSVFLDHDGRGSLATSVDQGRCWLSPSESQWRHIVAASVESDARLYIKTIEQLEGGLSLPVLLSSADGGRQWQKISLLPCSRGMKEVYAASTRGELYLGNGDGLFRRRAAGKDWERLLPASGLIKDPWIFDIKLGPAEPTTGVQKIYALSKAGLLLSSDSGKTWQIGAQQFASTSTMICVDDGGCVYLGSMGHGVRISKDQGKSWMLRALPEEVESHHITNIKVKGGVIYAALWDRREGGGGLAVSKDEGRSWRIYTKENSDLSDNDISALWIGKHGRVYAGTLNGGLCVSNEEMSSWEVLSSETTGSFRAYP